MQALADGLIAACAFLPVALGFFLYYRVSGILHFAHGAIVPISGFAFLVSTQDGGAPPAVGVLVALLVSVVVGLLIELVLYRPLRSWDRTRLATFVVSFAAYVILVGLLSILFGDSTQISGLLPVREGVDIAGARVSVARLMIAAAAVLASSAVWLFLHRTRQGLDMRAIASNAFLAEAAAVPLSKTYLWAIGMGSALAAIGGILMAIDSGVAPNAGLAPLLLAVIAVFVGGRTEFGVLAGALIIGLSQHIATIWISAKWQDTIAFALLSLMLLLRPGGLVGHRAPEIET